MHLPGVIGDLCVCESIKCDCFAGIHFGIDSYFVNILLFAYLLSYIVIVEKIVNMSLSLGRLMFELHHLIAFIRTKRTMLLSILDTFSSYLHKWF